MSHHTMTLEEWRVQQANATRPVTDLFMSTAKAERSRSLSAIAITSSAEDDALAKLVADRKRRNTANQMVPTSRHRGPVVCGTPQGYRAHQNANQAACLDCRKAFINHKRSMSFSTDGVK